MSQITNTLSSLLMSLPLIAVPCLAIFGLPTSDSDAAPEEQVRLEFDVPSGLGEATSSHSHEGHSHESPFGSIRDASQEMGDAGADQVSANTTGDRSAIDPTSGFQGAAANAALGLDGETTSSEAHAEADDESFHPDAEHEHVEHEHAGHEHTHAEEPTGLLGLEENPFVNDAPADPAVTETSATAEPPTSDPGWDAALDQLRALGVTRFHLTNSDIPGEFFFCCSVKTSRNILQRFEAEAATPVAAARDVLAQVESWQSTR